MFAPDPDRLEGALLPRPAIDAYTTGGLSYGEGPTDAFDDWDVVFDPRRHHHTTTATSAWREVDALWGLYGHAYARQHALDLLHQHATG